MKRYFPLLFLLTLLLSGCSRPISLERGEWIDLSYDFSSETVYWPTADTFKLEVVFNGMTEGGYYYSANNFCAAEHGGTHIDAPVHFARGKWSLEQVPLDHLIGPGVVVDVSEKALKNRDYLITVNDFIAWENANGPLPDGAIVLLRTGYGRYYPDRVKYMGTDRRGQEAVAELHFPGLHPDAAKWISENRNIRAIGLDTPSIDYGQSKKFESHQILFSHNIPAFENVANLERLPAKGAWIIALPMKIKGGSGGPLRIVAFLPESAS